jgi:hypothetical protein
MLEIQRNVKDKMRKPVNNFQIEIPTKFEFILGQNEGRDTIKHECREFQK